MILLAAYGLGFLALVVTFWAASPLPLDSGWLGLSFITGFEAFFLLCAMGVFSARPATRPLWDGKFFFSLHRMLGFLLGCLLAVHAGAFLFAEPVALVYFTPSAPWGVLSGIMGGLAILLCIATSFSLPVIKRLHVRERQFDALHRAYAAAGVLLSAAHVVLSHDHVVGGLQSAAIWLVAIGALAVPIARRLPFFANRLAVRQRPARRRRVAAGLPLRITLVFGALCLVLGAPLAVLSAR